MILRGRRLLTRSGKPKQGGQHDSYALVPQTAAETTELQKCAKTLHRATSFTGKATPRRLQDLRDMARAVDPNFTEDIQTVREPK